MALPEVLNQIMQLNSIFLIIAIIILFVIAYKVLKLIIQTAIVVVLSGLFYAALSYIGLELSMNIPTIMLFMFLGGLLFITYSFIGMLASGAIKIMGGISKMFKKPMKKSRKKKSKEKEVVLKKLKED